MTAHSDNQFIPPGEWAADPKRNCAGVDRDLFFPTNGVNRAVIEKAKKVCDGCPVLAECRHYSLSIPGLSGVWAGMTGKERRLTRKAEGYSVSRMVRVRTPAACGTTSGFNRHRDHHEDPCPSCREARNAYEADRKRRMRLVESESVA